MALTAINTVRQAELDAQKRIDDSQTCAQDAENKALARAEVIVAEAEKSVSILIDVNKDQASAQADEIVVTARNSAVLDAEKLKALCADKQKIINEKIISMII